MQCLVKLNTCMGIRLSEILRKSIQLNQSRFSQASLDLINQMAENKTILDDLPQVNTNQLFKLEEEIKSLIVNYQDSLVALNKQMRKIVYDDAPRYIEWSETIYQENIEKMTFDEHLVWSKLWPPNKEELDNFTLKIPNYCNWQYPGLIYGAKDSGIEFHMRICEPLFVLENHRQYHNLIKQKYTAEYSRKLKFYSINNLNALPKNDIGLIVAFNEFNFLPWTITADILEAFAKLLMPGGIIIFNYNNCASVRGFREFENRSMTYTTPRMFMDVLRKHNISLIDNYSSDKETFSYMILQKAGTKELIKNYPSIGYIRQQPTFAPNSVHHKKRLEYIRKLSEN